MPNEFGELNCLNKITLSNNQELAGNIPESIFNIDSLVWLAIGNCALLKSISFRENNLSGPIPPEIGNLDSLRFLELYNNQLTGQIPPELGNCANLWELRLNDNQLTGTIPVEVTQLNQLMILYLNNNNLSGNLPEYLSNLFFHNPPYSVSIDVSGNLFEGALPESWGNMTFNIDRLNISNNFFTSLPAVNYNWLITSFNIRENKFTFEYIEPHYQAYQAGCYYFFYYNTQDSMGVNIDTTLTPGSSYAVYSGTGGEYTNYKWYKNGELILESADADTLHLENITAADSGTYTCTAENSLLYELTLYRRPVHIIIDTSSGTININDPDSGISVYPNPASEKITISFPFVFKPIGLRIFDLEGKCVLIQQLTVSNHKIAASIKGLKSGIYFLRIQTENKIYSTKLIINKRGTHR